MPALGRAVRYGWAAGNCALAAHMAIVSVFLLYYLTEVQHFPGSLAGTLILIPRIWSAVSDPVVGGISDRYHSRWGRRRPFVLLGAILLAACYVAIFWVPSDLSLRFRVCWFAVWYFVANTALSIYFVPYSAMAAEMTQDYDERLRLIAYREVASRAAVLVTVMASPLLVRAAPDPAIGYRWVGIATGVIILCSGMVTFVATRQAPMLVSGAHGLSWSEQVRTFMANSPLLVLSGAFFLSSTCDAFYSALLIYFITLGLGQPAGSVGLLYPIGSLAAILATALWARSGSRWGKRSACLTAFAGGICCFLFSWLIPRSAPWLMFPFMMLLGACFQGMYVLPGSMAPDTVEYDEARSGMRREGVIFGAWTFTQQTGMAFGTFLVGICLSLIGYKSSMTSAADHWQAALLHLAFAVIPAGLLAGGVLFLRNFRLGRPGPAASASANGGREPCRM